MNIKEKIDKLLNWLPQLTQEEADFIESIVKWGDEDKSAFMFAKRLFEEKEPRERKREERKDKRSKKSDKV